jgi:O-antigen biosynthesis protein WbqP
MYQGYIKNYLDKILALILGILFLPIVFIISFLIFFETKKNPIISQERGIALNKKRIKIYKFRTFQENKILNIYNSANILSHPELSHLITRTGKILRLTGLDEIPQLWNVLKGEMSLVGPRPLIIRDLEQIKFYYPELYQRRENINVKPGITGLWQVSKDDNFSVEYLVNKDIEYQLNLSFINDLKILLKTLKVSILMQHKDSLKVSKENFYLVWFFNFVFNLYIFLLIIFLLNINYK